MSTGRNLYGLLDRGEIGFRMGTMSWAHWLAASLAAVTGAIHIFLYVSPLEAAIADAQDTHSHED